jgi:hypothetical protein
MFERTVGEEEEPQDGQPGCGLYAAQTEKKGWLQTGQLFPN